MSKATKSGVSPEVVIESTALAKRVKQPSQTKEQTRLIEQGIRKGLASYKQQQKAQAREQDRMRKKQLKAKQSEPTADSNDEMTVRTSSFLTLLPWGLLVLSWLGFVAYYFI